MSMFDGKKILITGGTGSLGQSLTKKLLEYDVDTIRIFSRNESKQVEMESKFSEKRLRFLIGDVRDVTRLSRAMEDIDIVIHAAAIKHVPVVEYNPFEAVKTNIIGSQNVIDASLAEDVEICVCVGTDKGVAPLNTYGASKLLMERLFVSASNYLNPIRHKTKFIAVRYGNVLGSNGSVVPKIIDQVKNGKSITITNSEMTRFNITMDQAIDLIFNAIKMGHGGEVFVPKLKAYRLDILKDSICEVMKKSPDIQKIPVRSGEKFHESLIGPEEIRNSYEIEDMYVILDKLMHDKTFAKWDNLKNCSLSDEYSSDKVEQLSKEELIDILHKEKLIIEEN